MNKRVLLALLIAAPAALPALNTGSAGNYGGSGFFLTPVAEALPENGVNIQAIFMQEPESNIQILGEPSPREGEDLLGGAVAFGMGGGWEAGWSMWQIGSLDMHHLGVKHHFARHEDGAWGDWAVGGALSITSAVGSQESEFVAYTVGSFPFSRGDASIGAGYVRDDRGDVDVAVFGNISWWLSERVRFWYEGTTASMIHGDVGHGGGLAWQASSADPVWLWAGATQLADYGINGPDRTDEWMFTAGIAVAINSHFTYEEPSEDAEVFETFGRP